MAQTPSTMGILGLGTVGEALLLMLRDTGHEVIGVDSDPGVLARVRKKLEALGQRPTGTTDAGAVVLTDETAALSRAVLVIEAVPEDNSLKTEVLRGLHTVCPTETTLVTTTVASPVARLAIASGRPGQTVGLRFLSPPVRNGPVEPVLTPLASTASTTAVRQLVSDLGLTPVTVGTAAGAEATALVYAYVNRAISLYEKQEASRDGIDTAMRLGCGLSTGPLELCDRIGLDTVLAGLASLRARTGDESFAPAPLLRNMVAEGRLGRKTGSGFYEYDTLGEQVDAPEPTAAAGPESDVRRIGVVGTGTMARGIAEISATAGFPTTLVGRSASKAAQALERIDESLTRGVRKGRVSVGARAAAADLLNGSDELSALRDCDLVIEAVVEDLEVKRSLFTRLGAECGPEAVLATTTSSLPVSVCGDASGRPSHTVGMHFFNPAPAMKLVELVRTEATSDKALAAAQAVCARLGKTTVDCRDRTGFIVNYLLFPYLGRALALLQQSEVGIEELDDAMTDGYGYPMGPFALLDAIGLDVSLAIQRELFRTFEDPDFAPSPVLRELVDSGWLGRKNRRGFRTAP